MRTPLTMARTMPAILRPELEETDEEAVELSARANMVADMGERGSRTVDGLSALGCGNVEGGHNRWQ